MAVSKDQMKRIEEFAKDKVSGLDYNHDWSHTFRTMKLVEIIAKKENADVEVCRVAALLHDVGQSLQLENHAETSEKMARELLATLKLPKNFIEKVSNAIAIHHDIEKIKNGSLEAKILYDADRLQIVGVFGFCRIISEMTAFKKMALNESVEKLQKMQEERFANLQTKTAREIIRKPHEFMQEFYSLYRKWEKVEF